VIHGDDRGPRSWNGVHVTHRTTVGELVDVDKYEQTSETSGPT